jgi:ABC-type transport system involved in multi-copper enzyme maturation permease subunit
MIPPAPTAAGKVRLEGPPVSAMTSASPRRAPGALDMTRVARQTWALTVDAYRELNNRKMFWLCLAISGLIVALFASLGLGERTFTFLGWDTRIPHRFTSAGEFYKYIFTIWGVDLWLAWAGLFLAIVSTASIFPDFLSAGSIDLYLCRPISRVRLFLTKYLTGLLFAFLQVTIFTVASFLVIGVRGGEWVPGLLVAIPIVVLLFSYFFCWSVLAGVVTRSATGAVLLTVALAVVIAAINGADTALMTTKHVYRLAIEKSRDNPALFGAAELAVASLQRQVESESSRTEDPELRARLEANRRALQTLREELRDAESTSQKLEWWHNAVFTAKTILPKTSETRQLLADTLNVHLFGRRERRAESEVGAAPPLLLRPTWNEVNAAVDREMAERTPTWTIATSMGYQLVILSIAGWLFSRRDY